MSREDYLDARTDRFMRRRFGWFDRRHITWALLRLNIAVRDARNETFAAILGRGRDEP